MSNQLYIKWGIELKNQEGVDLNEILGGNINELCKEFAAEQPNEFEEFAWEQYKVLTS